MRWRTCWARAQITPVLASAMFWIVGTAVAPAWVSPALLLVWAGSVMAWRSRVLRWWRYGARPLTRSAHHDLLRALVPASCLRGRQQPMVWRSPRLHGAVVAADSRNLIWADGLVDQIVRGQLSDDEASALAVHALGTADVQGEASVGVRRVDGPPPPEAPRPVLLVGEAPTGLWQTLTRLVVREGSSSSVAIATGRMGSPTSVPVWSASVAMSMTLRR